jgi:mono/diheme cytochrome c family protein
VKRIVAIFAVLVLLALAELVWMLNVRDEETPPDKPAAFTPTPQQVQRGEYLVRAGNCTACHTARGGAPYAGGRAIDTPFGTVYASNLTPDARTGIGSWSSAHFWRAMHNGRSRDGRLLYPAFPYPSFTLVTREDSDAIFAFLLSVPAVEQPNHPHALRFPYDSQAALAVWRALYFRPGAFARDAQQSDEWNRGAYLVRGLGHCDACHASRNILGATSNKLELGGGLIPMQNWYAPSLSSPDEAGVAPWAIEEVVQLLKAGVSRRASAMGPMAEVVYTSTRYLSDDDLRAMARYLKALPQAEEPTGPGLAERLAQFLHMPRREPDRSMIPRGAAIYRDRCMQCHGEAGEGAPGAYPALAGNRAVTLGVPANLIHVLLSGGYPPSTPGNPRPYGMPPYAHVLNDNDVAAVISYIRGSWGNEAAPVTGSDVVHYRR